MPITVDEIIARLGGADAAAAKLGIGTEAIRKWRQSHAIPARHWPALIGATGLALGDLPGPPARSEASEEPPPGATAVLVLADGSRFWGRGFGAHTPEPAPVGEVCFNT